MGLWRGKKGSSVFYYLRNSNNREKQGIREYQPVVANPQTAAQISQRVYLRPAQNIYRELADIIRRSWQGLEYGGKGTQEFFKHALQHGTALPTNIPWLNKGDQRAVPGAYQISNGSISEVVTRFDDSETIIASLMVGTTEPQTTWGEMSELLIAQNDIKNGDQLTFVVCASNQEEPSGNARFGWEVFSIYVDTTNTTEIIDLPKGRFVQIATTTRNFTLINNSDMAFPFLQAAAVIVSRLGNTGTYQRSPATIAVNQEGMQYYYTSARYLEARNSYRIWGGSTRSGNWIVDEDAGDAPASREKVDSTYTLTGLTGEKSEANGTPVRVQRYADDNSLAAVYVKPESSEGETVYPLINSNSGNAVVWTGTGGAFGYVFPADEPSLQGLTVIIQG